MNPIMSPSMIDKQWLIKSKIGSIGDDYISNPKSDVIIFLFLKTSVHFNNIPFILLFILNIKESWRRILRDCI